MTKVSTKYNTSLCFSTAYGHLEIRIQKIIIIIVMCTVNDPFELIAIDIPPIFSDLVRAQCTSEFNVSILIREFLFSLDEEEERTTAVVETDFDFQDFVNR